MPSAARPATALCQSGHPRLNSGRSSAPHVTAYVLHEAFPTKPFPDFMRYVLPIVPPLLIVAYGSLSLLGPRLARTGAWSLVPAVVVLSLALPAWETVRLVRHLQDDTRRYVAIWLAAQRGTAKLERYAGTRFDVELLPLLGLDAERAAGTQSLVAGSFTYDRFRFVAGRRFQRRHVLDIYRAYGRLFEYPCREFRPTYKSFAFSNPTIRVIDIGGTRITAGGAWACAPD